ncbi:MAG: HEPN domain-containing protein [Thermoprotei archaeon]
MKIDNGFKDYFDENKIIIKSIEDAYILSRYHPREYSKKEAEEMMKILLKFIDKFKKWIS